jgi:hypothetical protein
MADPIIYDEDSSIITDMDGGALYDEGPLEISVHDCGETDDNVGG